MKIYNVGTQIVLEEVPLCPLCGQPIENPVTIAVGGVEQDGWQAFCLVHEYCANEE